MSPYADAGVAIELASDVPADTDAAHAAAAIGGWAAAPELCDLGNVAAGADEVVATNLFHRAFAIGPLRRSAPDEAVARLLVDGIELDAAPVTVDDGALLVRVAQLLGESDSACGPATG